MPYRTIIAFGLTDVINFYLYIPWTPRRPPQTLIYKPCTHLQMSHTFTNLQYTFADPHTDLRIHSQTFNIHLQMSQIYIHRPSQTSLYIVRFISNTQYNDFPLPTIKATSINHVEYSIWIQGYYD
jgi:hemolysin activation/secretion protein